LLSSEQIVTLITALGCGIGKDDYNVAKLRYHRIIIMTDADVDGAHIRTLLLTLFYRQLPDLVEKGYIYIAQPPLLKIKHGKEERYLKDEYELRQYKLKLALNGAGLVTAAGQEPITGDALGELARSYLLSEAVIDRVRRQVDSTALEAIMDGVVIRLNNQAVAEESAKILQAALAIGPLKPEINVHVVHDEIRESWSLRIARRHHGNIKLSSIDSDFLATADYRQLQTTAETFRGLIGEGAMISRGERSQAVTDFKSAMKWLLADADRNVTTQRYKGLGEMNPSQLWETTMDPTVRRLLRVQIDDAIAADAIFTTLMGDEVEPRRAFIESNALRAGNIDV
jgi:DNA gyrase subunit B